MRVAKSSCSASICGDMFADFVDQASVILGSHLVHSGPRFMPSVDGWMDGWMTFI